MPTTRDYYEVLGITKTSDAKEIKKAFRTKAKALHPDTNPSPDAEAQFKELGEAYSVLSDAQKRQVYDQYGHEGLNGSSGGGGYGGAGGYSTNWDFMSDFGDLGDVFSAFFNGGTGGGRRQVARGSDRRALLRLTFMEAAFGAEKAVTVQRNDTCDDCDGSGAAPGTVAESCGQCGGHGQVRQSAQTMFGNFTQVVTCPACQGQGSVIKTPCSGCRGQGLQQKEETISVNVPAGVDSGTNLRMSGGGDAAPVRNGMAGDLFVVLDVEEDDNFIREGYDVLAKVPVCYTQLVLGDNIEIPLLKGSHRLKISAGTENAYIITLKGEGIPVLNQPGLRGNLLIRLDVQIPTKIDSRERDLLEQLHSLHADRMKQENLSHEDGKASNFFSSLKSFLSGK